MHCSFLGIKYKILEAKIHPLVKISCLLVLIYICCISSHCEGLCIVSLEFIILILLCLYDLFCLFLCFADNFQCLVSLWTSGPSLPTCSSLSPQVFSILFISVPPLNACLPCDSSSGALRVLSTQSSLWPVCVSSSGSRDYDCLFGAFTHLIS